MEGLTEGEEKNQQEFLQDKNAKTDSDEVIRIRKDKILGFFKKNYNWVVYLLLAFVVFLAVRIRTRNLSGLRDITTGGWALGPDLDPWLFTRWAEYIVEHGKLMAIDTMRYVPLGLNIKEEYLLHPYLMAWFHKALALFGLTDSVTYSAIIYPVFMFALTVIAFFFMVKKIFIDYAGEKKANYIALISSFFLSIFPVFLPRTIAGIPEKESAAFLFMFAAFYFFISSWKAKKNSYRYITAALAALATVAMANIWGGYVFIFLTLAPAVLICFLFNKIGKKEIYTYGIWLVMSLALMSLFSPKYTFASHFYSFSSAPAIAVLAIILIHQIIFNTKIRNYIEKSRFKKISPQLFSTIVSIILLALIASVLFGTSFIPSQLIAIKNQLIKPATSRLIQTVAENKQPYFVEWKDSFGPQIYNIPLTFWLFFIGSIYLFNNLLKEFYSKDRKILTLSYAVFLFSVVFSRYSSSSKFNGENYLSIGFYGLGFLIFIFCIGFYYYKYFKMREMDRFKNIDFSIIVLFSLFFLSIASARGLVRLVMILVPPVSIIISYFIVDVTNKARKSDEGKKIFLVVVASLILLSSIFSGYVLYKNVNSEASIYAPSIYNQQWQKAMAWVRESTPQDAVFAHWWDYGYWLQSIGERATVLDGGNAISYWNHLMGRYVLTGNDNYEALEFLYAHNTTHFLIDSSDIGKYGAFSYIGSNVTLDRRSYIPTLIKDKNQVQERKNSTVVLYSGVTGLDEDIIYDYNGTKIFLPKDVAAFAGAIVEKDSNNKIISAPIAIYVYQNQQYNLPLRYVYEKERIDFGEGLEAGLYIFPSASQNSGGLIIENDGAALYLSRRVVSTQLAKLYLYKEDNPYFKLAHSQDDFIVEQIKQQNPNFDSDLLLYGGLRGPIRIWEISYPEDIKFKEEYLSKEYPSELRLG